LNALIERGFDDKRRSYELNQLTLYFDESGFTGENLLSNEQKTFSYASVNITSCEAEALVAKIIAKYKIQNGELKAVKLIRRDKGKQVILEILEKIQDKIKISIHDKKFALTAHFFEYVFEPVLAKKSSIFYRQDFHKYISNVLYISLIANDELTNKIMILFEQIMRKKELSHLDEIISLLENSKKDSEALEFLKKMLIFIDVHKEIIYDEIKDLPSWTIDLSQTSLHSLFSEWGINGSEITAYCDNSKPINESLDWFEHMKGQKEIIFTPFELSDGYKAPITYNLKEISMVDSKEYAGVQLADIVATASTYSIQLNQEVDDYIEKLRGILIPKIIYASVVPDYEQIDLIQKKVQLNALLFEELIQRTENKTPVLDNIEEYIFLIKEQLELHPIL